MLRRQHKQCVIKPVYVQQILSILFISYHVPHYHVTVINIIKIYIALLIN